MAPWPWFVAGPLLGLAVPLFLWLGGSFGLSRSFDVLCGGLPADERRAGVWHVVVAVGIGIGGALAVRTWGVPDVAAHLSGATRADLEALSLTVQGWMPPELFSWRALGTAPGLMCIVGGGFLVGFGARYAGGCTSGHAVAGLSAFQTASLAAVVAFFGGGLVTTYVLLPLLLR